MGRVYIKNYIDRMEEAYKVARAYFEIYATAIEEEDRAWKNETARGWADAQQRTQATEKHNATLKDLKNRLETITDQANKSMTEIIEEATSLFDRHYMATAEQIDNNALALINSGIMTDKDLLLMADEYADNYTMRRLISQKLEDIADNTNNSNLKKTAISLKIKPTEHTEALNGVKMWYDKALDITDFNKANAYDKQIAERIAEISDRVSELSIPGDNDE